MKTPCVHRFIGGVGALYYHRLTYLKPCSAEFGEESSMVVVGTLLSTTGASVCALHVMAVMIKLINYHFELPLQMGLNQYGPAQSAMQRLSVSLSRKGLAHNNCDS